MGGLVSGGQAGHIPDFFPDGPPAGKRNMSEFGKKQRSIDRPEDGAIAECFPTQPIRSVQHDLERVGVSALALAGAK